MLLDAASPSELARVVQLLHAQPPKLGERGSFAHLDPLASDAQAGGPLAAAKVRSACSFCSVDQIAVADQH